MASLPKTHPQADDPATPDAITARVHKVLAAVLNVEPARLTDDARLGADLGADGLDAVNLAIALDDEFGIDLPNGAIDPSRTVGDLVAAVRQLVDAAAALPKGGL